jgi:hypothetical protein
MKFVVSLMLASLIGQAPAEVLDVARELAPLLRGIERRLPSELAVRPGQLPPSPFSGQRATLFAFRVSKERPELYESTEAAIKELLDWQAAPAKHPNTAPLAGLWMERLMVHVGDAIAGTADVPECDLTCTVSQLGDPGDAFGESPKERQETRDLILLQALAEAVAERTPPR